MTTLIVVTSGIELSATANIVVVNTSWDVIITTTFIANYVVIQTSTVTASLQSIHTQYITTVSMRFIIS